MTRDERAGTDAEGAAVDYHPVGKSKPFGDKLTAMHANRGGKVIGVNFATLSDFGGSNLAVPVRYADELVK
jgi:hypothetical protein